MRDNEVKRKGKGRKKPKRKRGKKREKKQEKSQAIEVSEKWRSLIEESISRRNV